jgi:glucokinase
MEMFKPKAVDVPWLMIDASLEGILRYASAMPSKHPVLSPVRQIDIRGIPTFTDALQRLERESGLRLGGVDCAIAICGALSGESLALMRSRWTISRSGLSALFQRPATILNNAAARAWAIGSGSATISNIRGVGAPNLSSPGRYVMINIDQGLGACVIDVDLGGTVRILESEAGHTHFVPSCENEEKLARAVRGSATLASWENVLLLDPKSPVWREADPNLGEDARERMLGSMIGRFIVNLTYVYGAWQGLLLTGRRTSILSQPAVKSAFETAFNDRRKFSRLIAACPVWRVEQNDAVLIGSAQCLAQTIGVPLRQAA